jgi:hypothetical protein
MLCELACILVVFIIPFITTRITMMLGNWAQHSFVCPEDPGNEYKSSFSCINNIYNQRVGTMAITLVIT